MSELERKWWFIVCVAVLTVPATIGLMHAAGLPPFDYDAAQWAIWLLCYFGLQRGFSFLGWLIVLTVSPKTVTAGRT